MHLYQKLGRLELYIGKGLFQADRLDYHTFAHHGIKEYQIIIGSLNILISYHSRH